MNPLLLACALLAAPPPPARAALDPRLGLRVVARQRLLYADGADARADRPAHVRAASGLAWYRGRLAIAQDDAGFIALWDPATHRVDHLDLPRGPGGRRQFDALHGNKADKLDLEALAATPDGGLLAFGSGSRPVREVVVSVSPAGQVAIHPLPRLFARLHAWPALGSELNLEGAVLTPGGGARLFQRGNGAPRAGLAPVDATVEIPHLLDPETVPRDARTYDLGRVRGVRLTFTDATLAPGGHTLYLASAEDSPDAVRDGPVAGSALGVLDAAGAARQVLLPALADKLEGVALDATHAGRVYLVADPDDPLRPAVLLTAELTGPWFERP